jgi:hypothetical protein
VIKRIMISGAIASHPLSGAGNTWAFLQYILGLRNLGFEVYYVEHLTADQCVDGEWKRANFSSSANVRYFREIMKRFDLTESSSLLECNGSGSAGLNCAEIEKLAPEVDLLINLSGHMHLRSILSAVRRRMYIDLDPGYTQIWHERYGVDMNLRDHDVHVTVGLNLGEADCPLPTCGIQWHKTLPPVVMEHWSTAEIPRNVYSTIAEWRGFSPVEWHGTWYNQKADEFKRIIDLPRRVAVPLELCLFIHPDETDRFQLEQHGWQLVSPAVHAASPDSYRDYIIRSHGEFTAVKHGYAAGRTGWFSDRSAHYLAAGRPVIMQDTGVGRHVATGTGLITFNDLDSAVDAIAQVEDYYPRHAAAAAAFAREYLDSNIVLPRLLQLAGI